MADGFNPESAGEKPGRESSCHHHHNRDWGGTALGSLWFIGWLFTIGYLHLPFFWKGVLALIIWPYYLGSALVH